MKFCSVVCVILYSCCVPGRSILSNIRRGWKWVTHVFKTRNDSDFPAPFREGAGVLYIAIKARNELWHFNNVMFVVLMPLIALVQVLFLFFPAHSQKSVKGHKSRFMLESVKARIAWSSPSFGLLCWVLEWK